MKRIFFYFTSILLLLTISIDNLNAQIDTSMYNHSTYRSAMSNIDNMQYDKAIQDLVAFRAITSFNKDVRTLKLLADCYWKVRKYKESKFCYDTLVKSDIVFTAVENFHVSELSAMNGNYGVAVKYLKSINGFQNKLYGYNHLEDLNKEDLAYTITESDQNLSPTLFPAIIKDSLIWVTKNQILSAPKGSYLAKYFSANNNMRINTLFETTNQEAKNESIFSNPSSYTYSKETGKIYFTMFQNFFLKKKVSNQPNYFKVAESKLQGARVSEINVFTLGDGSYSMLQPVISENGKLLVFISNFIDNQFDFYYSEKSDKNNEWSTPALLNVLNTKGDEVFPSFGIDGYLYFSSNGRAGLGGLDIYKVNLKLLGGDDEIIHLPPPINSRHDDYGFNLTNDINSGSFISKRNGNDISYDFVYNNTDAELEESIENLRKIRNNVIKLNRIKLLDPSSAIGGIPTIKLPKTLYIKKEQILKFNQGAIKQLPQSLKPATQTTIEPKLNQIQNKALVAEDKVSKKPELPKNEESKAISKIIKNKKPDSISTSIKMPIGAVFYQNKNTILSTYDDSFTKKPLVSISNNAIKKITINSKISNAEISKSAARLIDTIPQNKFIQPALPSNNVKSILLDSTSKIEDSKTDLVNLKIIQNRISQKPILIYTAADSVTIDLYDNGNYDNDTISIIYNKVMVVVKKEISTDEKKPVRFSFKLDVDELKNEIIIVADNLGTEAPNTALIVITDSFKKQYLHYVSTDLLHNAVIYFKKTNKKNP